MAYLSTKQLNEQAIDRAIENAREQARQKEIKKAQEELAQYKKTSKNKAKEQAVIRNVEDAIKKADKERLNEKFKKFQKVSDKIASSGEKAFKGTAKSVKFTKKLSSSLLGYANAFSGGSNQSHSGPGRPRNSLKWRSPFTGKPIPATIYYKEVRAYRRMQEQKAEQIQRQQLQQLAKKGINPNQAQEIQQRMNQQALLDQSQNQMNQRQSQNQRIILPQNQINPQANTNQVDINQLPIGTVIPTGNKIWRFERGVVGTEGGLFGPVKKLYGQESSFWN